MTIPKGTLFPMCGMNLAFNRELIGPAMYFGLMGDGQPIGRYDDMWAGWCIKVHKSCLPFLVALSIAISITNYRSVFFYVCFLVFILFIIYWKTECFDYTWFCTLRLCTFSVNALEWPSKHILDNLDIKSSRSE